jgi:hypothetical protein
MSNATLTDIQPHGVRPRGFVEPARLSEDWLVVILSGVTPPLAS